MKRARKSRKLTHLCIAMLFLCNTSFAQKDSSVFYLENCHWIGAKQFHFYDDHRLTQEERDSILNNMIGKDTLVLSKITSNEYSEMIDYLDRLNQNQIIYETESGIRFDSLSNIPEISFLINDSSKLTYIDFSGEMNSIFDDKGYVGLTRNDICRLSCRYIAKENTIEVQIPIEGINGYKSKENTRGNVFKYSIEDRLQNKLYLIPLK